MPSTMVSTWFELVPRINIEVNWPDGPDGFTTMPVTLLNKLLRSFAVDCSMSERVITLTDARLSSIGCEWRLAVIMIEPRVSLSANSVGLVKPIELIRID